MPFDNNASSPTPVCRHPKAGVYATYFEGVTAFEEAEARIAALPTEREREEAFEVFTEAAILTGAVGQADMVWPVGSVSDDVVGASGLPKQILSVCGVMMERLEAGDAFDTYRVRFCCRRDAPSWDADRMGEFASASQMARFKYLITNADDVQDAAFGRGVITINGVMLDALTDIQMEAVAAAIAGRLPEPAEKRTARPYQQRAIDAVVAELMAEREARATMVSACGTGKTAVGLWIAEQHVPIDVQPVEVAPGDTAILVLLPSLALVRQTLMDWVGEQGWGHRFRYLCVCSDETVAKGDDGNVVHINDIPSPVENDPVRIAAFLRRTNAVKVIFSTYQSSRKVGEAVRIVQADHPVFRFRLGLFDEAHKTAGHEGTDFAYALKDENVPIANRLFMTATPRVYTVRGKGKEGQDGRLPFLSMDDEAVYGTRAYTLSFREAVDAGAICRYKVIISVVTPSEIDKLHLRHLENGKIEVDGKAMGAKEVASLIALRKAMEQYDCRKAITFHPSISMASSAQEMLSGDGPLSIRETLACEVFHVSGDQNTKDREATLKDFKRCDRGVITNARCLTEGVDVPAVDLVAFMAPKKSKIDIVQSVGRAVRKPKAVAGKAEKQFGYILVPLFLDLAEGESIEAAAERADFDDIWTVLSGLMDMDYDLVDVVNRMRQDRARTGSFGNGLRDFVDIIGAPFDLDAVENVIDVRLVERLSSSWDEGLGRLKAYVDEHGDACVPQKYETQDGFRLGSWVGARRHEYNSGSLAQERIVALEKYPGWTWYPFEDAWNRGMNALRDYVSTHGHARVPQEYKTQDGLKLATWVRARRENYRSGTLSPERIAALGALPGWTWSVLDDAWNQGMNALRHYVATHGHALVPLEHKTETGFGLGSWVGGRRKSYSNGKLSADRVAALEALPGWTWSVLEDAWSQGMNALRHYVATHGHARVPHRHKTADGFVLGVWISVRRREHSNGTLSPERIAALEALPGWTWSVLDDAWNQGMNALRHYVATHGHALVPLEHKTETGFGLGSWVGGRRKSYSNGKLSADRVAALEALPGWTWSVLEDAWSQGMNALRHYVATHGHARVPHRHKTADGFVLGVWISVRRREHSNGTLSPERIAALEALPGWTWSVLDDAWSQCMDALRDYVATHGHARVPHRHKTADGFGLGSWVGKRRGEYKSGKLSADRAAALEALPGWSHS